MELTTILLLLAGILGLARTGDGLKHGLLAIDDTGDYVCNPTDITGSSDMDAPCNAVGAISAECEDTPYYYGDVSYSSYDDCADANDGDGDDCEYCNNDDDDYSYCYFNATLMYIAQQVCYCSSQFWDVYNGCASCLLQHGLYDEYYYADAPQFLASLSSAYCDVSFTATDDLFAFASSVSITTPTGPSFTPIFSTDTLGTVTDASIYYTPASVTGSDAYIVPSPTLTGAPSVKDGQIKATAVANFTPPPTATSTTTIQPDASSGYFIAISSSTTKDDSASTASFDSTVTVPVTASTSDLANAGGGLKALPFVAPVAVRLVGGLAML